MFFRVLTTLAEGRMLEVGSRWFELSVGWGWYCVISATMASTVTDEMRTTLLCGASANSINTIIRRGQSR